MSPATALFTGPRYRRWRALLTAVAAAILITGPRGLPVARRTQAIIATPVGGRMALADGVALAEIWALSSPYSRFGGWSGLAVLAPRRFLMVADNGETARFTLGDGRIDDVAIRPLAPIGARLSKRQVDFESLTISPDGRTAWIGVENVQAILRVDTAFTGRPAVLRPAAMRGWDSNGGPETLARLRDGRFLTISETTGRVLHGNKVRHALLFNGDPLSGAAALPFYYDPQGKGDPTDAAALPDGRLLILHRRIGLSGFNSTLAIADPRAMTAGATLRSVTVAALDKAGIHENFEGLAIDKETDGVSVWIVADDNFLSFQRSLLVRLTMSGAMLARVRTPAP